MPSRGMPWGIVIMVMACHPQGLEKQRADYAEKDQKRITLRMTATSESEQKLAFHFLRPAHRVSLGQLETIDAVVSNHHERATQLRFDIEVKPVEFRPYLLVNQDMMTKVTSIEAHQSVSLQFQFGIQEGAKIVEDIVYIKLIPRQVSAPVANQVDEAKNAL